MPDRPAPKRPEVLVTTASTGEGVPELLVALDRQRAGAREGGSESARRPRAAAQIRAILAERLAERLRDDGLAPLSDALLDDVAEHRVDPYTAADRLLDAILLEARERRG